jgi:hypothetical protein
MGFASGSCALHGNAGISEQIRRIAKRIMKTHKAYSIVTFHDDDSANGFILAKEHLFGWLRRNATKSLLRVTCSSPPSSAM